MQENKIYGFNTKLQEAAAEYEGEKAAMETAIKETLASASARADEYDYKGGADILRASQYYSVSSVLQTTAAQYDEAEKNKGNIDEQTLAQADTLAEMYDYDGAIDQILEELKAEVLKHFE